MPFADQIGASPTNPVRLGELELELNLPVLTEATTVGGGVRQLNRNGLLRIRWELLLHTKRVWAR